MKKSILTKENILKIAVVAIALLFITETFYFGNGLSNLFRPSSSGSNITGVAVFNGTIRTYDPFLFVQGQIPQPVIDKLNAKKEIRSIQQVSGGIMINLDSRDSVYPIAVFLRENNVTSYSRANIVVDEQIVVQTLTGKILTSIPNGVIQVISQPLVDADSVVPIQMEIVLSNDVVIYYGTASLLEEDITLNLDAQIISLDHKTYTYIIPWEDRNSLGNLSAYGDINYKKVDSIIFTQPLSVDQILLKKNSPFITYIDANSAQVESSFDDLEQLNSTFQGIGFVLPSSNLVITTNTTPDLQYNSTVVYNYIVTLNSTYTFEQDSFLITSSTPYEDGSDIKVSIDVLAMGNRVLSIKHVSLPS
ncbi:MAG: hypothetical protein ABID61_01940 [Candidatus Micrarchaeota archaeon]